jgi:hypothetical protein
LSRILKALQAGDIAGLAGRYELSDNIAAAASRATGR